MSSKKIESLSNIKPGSYQNIIQVRVIRFWRGKGKTGEEFKCFNILLLDKKKNRFHAFIPTKCADQHVTKLSEGNLCNITNFSVQKYKTDEKFRCLRNEYQLVFTTDTKIQEINDNGITIPEDEFDFYDHSELKDLAKQTAYLADVVGIMQQPFQGLNKLQNKKGIDQCQAKFIITDGDSQVKVTFWDNYAETFAKAMLEPLEQPVIVIIASARVGWWNNAVDLSHVGPTKFYLNYKHHSVYHFRKLLRKPEFAKQFIAAPGKKLAELLTVAEIKNLGKEYIENQVITHVTITRVEDTGVWYFTKCTTCHNKTDNMSGYSFCGHCNKIVSHPDKEFNISVTASDETGGIDIILEDRPVRMLIGRRARHVYDEVEKEGNTGKLPQILKNIANQKYTIKLSIREMNVVDSFEFYWATNICKGFKLEEADTESDTKEEMEQSTTQATTSTQRLQGMSDLNFESN